MTGSVVLQEKLRIPEVVGLVRKRLEQALLSPSPGGVDLVVAPAGCGKTTLLSRLATVSPAPVAWYRVTAEDSTQDGFVAHLGSALSPIADTAAARTMPELLAALDRWPGSAAMLILDDLHEIAGTSAEAELERFVSLRTRRLQVICGARRVPDINVPRIRVSGGLRELNGDDLRFRSWEVEELFASVYLEPLRPEAAAALTRRTGGWAAGLQLFHLATLGRTAAERHQAVADLAGRSKLVRSYLTRNVLAELPADRREFLLRTCTLGRLSGQSCDALLGAGASHRVLEELENAQLFTFTDDGGRYFRYHEVLQSHLELALVEQYGPAEARSWYLRSARVHEALGDLRSAARAFAKAEDWVAVSRLVRDNGGPTIDATQAADEQLLPVSTWRQDPWLALANARRLLREGALADAAEAYRHAQTLYDEPNYQQICRQEAQVVAVWLPGYRTVGPARRTTPQPPHTGVLLRDALNRSPESWECPGAWGGDPWVRALRGLAALAAGDLGAARTLLAPIGCEPTGDCLATVAAGVGAAVLDLLHGRGDAAGTALAALATLAENEGLPWVSRLCHGLEQIALAGSQDGRLLESCSDLVRAADHAGDRWGAGLLGLAVGVAKLWGGQGGAAELSAAGRQFAALGAPVLELWCGLLAIGHGAEAAARDALQKASALRARGAQAVALALLASATTGGQSLRLRDAAEALAGECGLPLPVDPPAVTSPQAVITCFGDYRISIGGKPCDLGALRPQARHVLAILSLAPGREHHREFLEDILWPGIDHSVAGHRLQVAVSSVRAMFGDSAVVVDRCGKSYRLVLPPGSAVDVAAFDEAVASASALSARGDVMGRIVARREALRLYCGDLLPEITGSAHIDAERDRLRRSAAAASAALAGDLRTLGDHEQALVTAQRSVQLDAYQETAWLILADLHEKAGDAGSAEYVRREHARVRAELDVLPL